VWLSGCETERETEEVIRPVRYQQVYATGVSRTRVFTGVAQSAREADLSFKVPGNITELPVNVGANVAQGELIAALEPTDYQIQVERAEAALSQAEAQQRTAAADYQRVQAMYESANASRSDLDRARAASESAEAAVEGAKKQLELARLQLEYTRLEAPWSGSIAEVNVEQNENVTAGKMVAKITGGEGIEVSVAIPEVLISQIKPGLGVTVDFSAIPDEGFSGTVSEVGIATTGFATTYPVTIDLIDTDPRIRSGMAAEVTCQMEAADERERFLVASTAVSEDRQGRYVFVAIPLPDEPGFGTVRRAPVTVGDLVPEGMEILQGLNDGDLVITAGVSRIENGMKVRL
jgi:RND family efflux transporter MFP subunit